MRIGAPIFTTEKDWEKLAQIHLQKGYRAASDFFSSDISVTDTDEVIRLRKTFQQADIVLAEVGAWSNPVSLDPQTASNDTQFVINKLALAEELGARCCVNIAGSWCDDCSYGPDIRNYSKDFYALVVDTYRAIVDAVNPRYTKMTFELMPYNFLDSADACVQLLKDIDRDCMAYHYDPSNTITSPRDYYDNSRIMREAVKKMGDKLVSCHIKDIAIDIHALNVVFKDTVPGRGNLDYNQLLRSLHACNPDMPLIFEHLHSEAEYDEGVSYLEKCAAKEQIPLYR